MRVGIVGCGKVAHIHAAALRALGRPLAACHDANPARAGSFAAIWGGTAFEDFAAMLRVIDALLVCTPHPLHAEAVVEALDAGVACLVEKPLAANLQDCDRMIEAASRASLGVVSQRRFYLPVQRMRAAIDAGKIGKPVLGTILMLSWRDEAYYRSDPWRGTWQQEGGGVLVNQAPHQLDILLWLMGPVEEVSAYWDNLNHPYMEVEDTAVAALRFRNGGLGSIVTSVSQNPGIYTKVHIHGSKGYSVGVQTDTGASFVAGMSGIAEPPFNDVWTIPGETAGRDAPTENDMTVHYHSVQLADFLEAVNQGRKPLVTAEQGRAVVELITAIYRSNNERRPVRLPLQRD